MKKGFTLLELIIVIGILAVLGTVSVLVLNPAQLFAQARDTTRIQDMATLNSALGLYLSTVSSPDLDGPGVLSCSSSCFVVTPTSGSIGINCGSRHVGATNVVATRVVDGTGWLPVNFGAMTAFGGSPLAVLPIDPTNDGTYFYSYACDNSAKTVELNANLESVRYCSGGTDDKETKDGGNMNTGTDCTGTAVYESGTDSGLNL